MSRTILFFDTETTGFPWYDRPADHPSQPHIVQLAAQLCTDAGDVIAGFSFVIDPEVDIPESASDIHGITTEYASQFGVSLKFAMEVWLELCRRTEMLCAHNFNFDQAVINTALMRERGLRTSLVSQKFCTMEASAPILNLPPTERMIAAGFDKPKAPKLEECIEHFFGERLDGAHDAMIDVEACRRVYFHLQDMVASTGSAK